MKNNDQIYFILEQNNGWVTFDQFYTSDIPTVIHAIEKSQYSGKRILIYYFPQMKEIKNFQIILDKVKKVKK